MNDRLAERATSWNAGSASRGSMVRFRPTMPPTKALMSPSGAHCGHYSRRLGQAAGRRGP